jgi:hypothetical protein
MGRGIKGGRVASQSNGVLKRGKVPLTKFFPLSFDKERGTQGVR